MEVDEYRSMGTLTGWQVLANQVLNAGGSSASQQQRSSPTRERPTSAVLPRLSSSGSVEMSEASEAGSVAACVTPRPHQWLYKEYKLLEDLGSGGFGVVKKARRLADGRLVVVKEIKTTALSAKQKAAVMDEVETLAKLTHPNIVKYCDCFMDDVYINIVMEYCDAGDLAQLIERRGGHSLDEDTIMFNFVQVACALGYVHQQGILHRDLKPSNVFVTSSGQVKLGDFGVSKAGATESTLMGRSIVGTPHYLSPEMCENKPYGKKSDVWALGCILGEMCLRAKAFNGSSISTIILQILRGQYPPLPDRYSPELKGLVACLLHPDPARRPYVTELLQMPYVREHLQRYLTWAQHTPEAQPDLLAACLAAAEPSRRPMGRVPSHQSLLAMSRLARTLAATGSGNSSCAGSAVDIDTQQQQQVPAAAYPAGYTVEAPQQQQQQQQQTSQFPLLSQLAGQQQQQVPSGASQPGLLSGVAPALMQVPRQQAAAAAAPAGPTLIQQQQQQQVGCVGAAAAGPVPGSAAQHSSSAVVADVPGLSELLAAQTNGLGASSGLAEEQLEGLRRLRDLKSKLRLGGAPPTAITSSSNSPCLGPPSSLQLAAPGVAQPSLEAPWPLFRARSNDSERTTLVAPR